MKAVATLAPEIDRRWSWIAGAIAVFGSGVQIYLWGFGRPLWLDEQMIALNLRDRTLAELAGPLWLGQSAPLGWLILQRLMVVTFGTGELALRLLPLVCGIATLATAFWIGRRWMNPLGACALVLLCALGQWLSFHVLELKHYSADAFLGLLLPSLAVWAIESPEGLRPRLRRLTVWWVVASAGLWLANGAVLVAPACATVVVAMLWLRDGATAARRATLLGAIWLVSFGVHFFLSGRYTLGSAYLLGYWTFALPPAGAGGGGTLSWLASQFAPFAFKPGGSTRPLTFWTAALFGYYLGSRRNPALGIVFALVPVSAFVFAGLRIVPLFERLSLWIVPAFYVGIALTADAVARLGRTAYMRGHRAAWVWVAVGGLLVFIACDDVVRQGVDALRGWQARSNHALDDRSAVRWLEAQRQPGDVWMTTRLGLPAIWWYGGVRVSEPTLGREEDGSRILEVDYRTRRRDCSNDLNDALSGSGRVLLHLGFRFDDVPRGFDDLLFDELAARGQVISYRRFAESSLAAVVDLQKPSITMNVGGRPDGPPPDMVPRPPGCLHVRPAQRW